MRACTCWPCRRQAGLAAIAPRLTAAHFDSIRVAHERSVHDRRSIRVRATAKGRALSQKLSKMHQRHLEQLQETDITETDLKKIAVTLRRLERFWLRTADLTSRSPEFAA